MKCYFLQGTLGIATFAAIIGVTVLLCWGGTKVIDSKDEFTLPGWMEFFGKLVTGALLCFFLAMAIWQLGGEVLHSWFRWCGV